MSGRCNHHVELNDSTRSLRRIVWLVLVLNLVMFGVEMVWGWLAGSVALHADAIDFFGDAAAYAVTLFVLQRSMRWRAGAALGKAGIMVLLGCLVLGEAAHGLVDGDVPDARAMGAVGVAALIVNAVCAVLLFAHRGRDVNLRSVWLCSRNDLINNVAVVIAALGVFGTATRWPDLGIALVIAALNFWSAAVVAKEATAQLASERTYAAKV